MNKEYIKILDNELNKMDLRDNTKRCYKNAFAKFIRNNKESDILEGLKSIKNKTALSQVVNSIRIIQQANNNINIIDEDELKLIIKNKSRNRHKSYEPYELKDALRKINALRNDKYKLAYRLMIASGLRVFEIESLEKDDIKFNGDDIFVTVRDGKGGKFGEVKCLEDKYLSKKLKGFLVYKESKDKIFYSKSVMQEKANKLGFKCHDLRRAYAKLVKKELVNNLVEVEKSEKEKIIEKEVKTALRHSKFETSKRYLYSKRIEV